MSSSCRFVSDDKDHLPHKTWMSNSNRDKNVFLNVSICQLLLFMILLFHFIEFRSETSRYISKITANCQIYLLAFLLIIECSLINLGSGVISILVPGLALLEFSRSRTQIRIDDNIFSCHIIIRMPK